MICKRTSRQLGKRAAALAVSLVMAMGMVAALPEQALKDNVTVASAWEMKQGHMFFYEKINSREARLTGVEAGDKNLSIPSEVEIEGEKYTVTEIGDDVAVGASVFSIVIPASVTKIGDNFARYALVDNIRVPENITYIGDNFCSECTGLKTVEYKGNKLEHLGVNPFGGDNFFSHHYRTKANSKNAICFGDWLIAYYGDKSEVRVQDLGEGSPIKGIAANAFTPPKSMGCDPTLLTSVDLEGVKYIGDGAFRGCTNLEEIKNDSKVEYVGAYALHYSKWYANEKANSISTLGKVLMWYKSDDKEIDLTGLSMRNIQQVYKFAFMGCPNADTIKMRSFMDLSEVTFGKQTTNDLYSSELYDLKEFYVDGKKIEYNVNTPVDPSLSTYAGLLSDSVLEADMIEAKTKAVFEELGIKYYGPGKKAEGLKLSDQCEISKKIHDYIAANYEFGPQAKTLFEGYIAGSRMDSEKFASLYAYMLRCAGLESMMVTNKADTDKSIGNYVYDHSWTLIKLGTVWYHSDVCWDSASQGNTDKYFAMSDEAVKELPQHEKWELSTPVMDLKVFEGGSLPGCKKQLGDTNADGLMTSSDLSGYKDIVQGKAKGNTYTDINFDGTTNISDMLLLDDILNKNRYEPTNTNSKPANSIMAKNGKIQDIQREHISQFKVFVASERKILSDYLELFPGSMFTLPEFNYETASYEEFEKWDLGYPGDTVQLTKEVTILRPVWKNDSSTGNEMMGDVNFDGKVDIMDAVIIISYLNGISSMETRSLKVANVNRDGVVDIEDAVSIIGHVNGLNQL